MIKNACLPRQAMYVLKGAATPFEHLFFITANQILLILHFITSIYHLIRIAALLPPLVNLFRYKNIKGSREIIGEPLLCKK